jgi:hypothetical protein
VGWHASLVQDTALVTTALKMALRRRDHADRRVDDGLIHHSEPAHQQLGDEHPSRNGCAVILSRPCWGQGMPGGPLGALGL